MFERRVKIILLILLIITGCLALRAAQIQILDHEKWRAAAADIMKRDEFVETTRGTIFDRKNRPIAIDSPCIDASVDYRAITEEPDPDWIRQHAVKNLKDRLGDEFRGLKKSSAEYQAAVDDECEVIRGDIAAMWQELSAVSGKTPEQIDEIRRDIVQRVEMRKRYKWWSRYQSGLKRNEQANSSFWYREFLTDNDPNKAEQDKFELEVAEESAPHMILHNISSEVQARLARQQDRFFCLTLVPSKYREYPYGRVACHIVGYMQTARPEEITADAGASDVELQDYWSSEAARFWTKADLDSQGSAAVSAFRELRRYWPTDLVGRTGLESACEDTLRGTRGKIVRVAGKTDILSQVDSVPGRNVSSSIDIELQRDIENEFVKTRVLRDKAGNVTETRYNQHGAAVVIDIKTNQVLALVSAPGYDPKDLETQYAVLVSDELDHPLMDRATQFATVPGSTVKPILGLGSITDGIMKPTDTIQCRGELMIEGKPQTYGHCWMFNQCKAAGVSPSHGPYGAGDNNIGPDDMLTISDGIRDSCNVVFETIALRMTMPKLSVWFNKFGLGKRTGIGIEESPGLIYTPSAAVSVQAQTQTWSAGIGEGHVQATPLQMANVAATIARNGLWMRPHLVTDDDLSRQPGDAQPDQIDLHLPREALDAVQKGMKEVCTYKTSRGDGSGWMITPEGLERGPNDPPLSQDPLQGIPIAGKTGSAQLGGLMSIRKFDADGKPAGYQLIHFGDPGTEGWYLQPSTPMPDEAHPEHHLAQAWFIGYAPADHPQIAFCVLVEYGNAGNLVAGPIAHDLLVDCVNHGYLSPAK
jgi:cell division protein FtsI/penicillin-binding protein 2